jgi:hypothetical protein
MYKNDMLFIRYRMYRNCKNLGVKRRSLQYIFSQVIKIYLDFLRVRDQIIYYVHE